MGYTKFGEFVRVLRVKNHQIMKDMADKLNVTTPFLSAVETGKKNVPQGWFSILSNEYKLSSTEKQELQNAIEESKTQIKINLQNANFAKKQIARQFARSFDNMDAETMDKIAQLLTKTNNSNKEVYNGLHNESN